MAIALRRRVLPEHQRRTREELSEELELRAGDAQAKVSAFWTMLVLSAVIASAGVLADSTATVIGAMIIAPLSTPIMGIALAVVKRQRNGSVAFVCLGAALVVAIGVVFSISLPKSYDLLGNSQIASRVTPNLIDLVAALATGLAGAVALARRDVAAVLPGVAISISLVPPLAVAGVCLGQGSLALAGGAVMLFLSNLVSLVLAGIFVFTVLGYSTSRVEPARNPRTTYVTLAILFGVVLFSLGANTALTYQTTRWERAVNGAASDWLEQVPGATVDSVDLHGTTFDIYVTTPDDLPPADTLLDDLDGDVPNGFNVTVTGTVGQTIEVGTVGN
jgi:uncharacterized hydrophobic protein (TIGR00271 family)